MTPLPASCHGAPLPSSRRLVTLFSLVCKVCRAVTLQGEERHLGALIGDQREAVGIVPTTPGKLTDYGCFLSLWSHPILREAVLHSWCGVPHLGGMLFLHSHVVESPNPVSPNCQLPTPMGSKVQSSGAQGWGLLGPHPTLPKKGELCPRRRNSCSSRAVGPGTEVQVSTGGLVLLTHPVLQVWLGTSCAVHWPGFSSGVLPE